MGDVPYCCRSGTTADRSSGSDTSSTSVSLAASAFAIVGVAPHRARLNEVDRSIK